MSERDKRERESLTARAAQFAREAHKGQLRQGGEQYITHPISVGDRLVDAGVKNEVVIAAAYLHDTIEDTEVTYDQLLQEFGHDVASTVDQLTLVIPDRHVSGLSRDNWNEMKTLVLMGKILEMRPEAKLIKLADRIDNLIDARVAWGKDRLHAYAKQADRMLFAMQLAGMNKKEFQESFRNLKNTLCETVNDILEWCNEK